MPLYVQRYWILWVLKNSLLHNLPMLFVGLCGPNKKRWCRDIIHNHVAIDKTKSIHLSRCEQLYSWKYGINSMGGDASTQ